MGTKVSPAEECSSGANTDSSSRVCTTRACVQEFSLLRLDSWAFLGFPRTFWSLEAAVAASPPGQREPVSQELLLTSRLLPSQWQAPSLSQSLSWASNREDCLPKKERTQFGFSLRPWGCMNPLPKLNLTANGSQDFAGFPPQGKPSMALNLASKPITCFSLFYPKTSLCAPKTYHRSLTPKQLPGSHSLTSLPHGSVVQAFIHCGLAVVTTIAVKHCIVRFNLH